LTRQIQSSQVTATVLRQKNLGQLRRCGAYRQLSTLTDKSFALGLAEARQSLRRPADLAKAGHARRFLNAWSATQKLEILVGGGVISRRRPPSVQPTHLPLTCRAKIVMMLESPISLVTVVAVASRAINILGTWV